MSQPMYNLAWTWKEKGRWEEGMTLLADYVKSAERVLGAQHDYTVLGSKALMSWQTEKLKLDDVEKSN